MNDFEEPIDQGVGEARRFLASLRSAQDFLSSYETMAPILDLAFDHGRQSAVPDLEDVPIWLYDILRDWFDPPYMGVVTATATVLADDRPYRFEVSVAHHPGDGEWEWGPLVLTFNDESRLTASFEPAELSDAENSGDEWTRRIASGAIQRELEAVVSLASMVELTSVVSPADQQVTEALLQLLGDLARSAEPPRGVVREAASWIWKKVDRFLDEATKTGGKATGVAVIGAAGLTLEKHAPQLAEHLRHLLEVAS